MFEGLNVKKVKVCDMKKEIIRFFKMWTLPLGMLAGVGVYLMFHCIPLLSPLKVLEKGQRISSCRSWCSSSCSPPSARSIRGR